MYRQHFHSRREEAAKEGQASPGVTQGRLQLMAYLASREEEDAWSEKASERGRNGARFAPRTSGDGTRCSDFSCPCPSSITDVCREIPDPPTREWGCWDPPGRQRGSQPLERRKGKAEAGLGLLWPAGTGGPASRCQPSPGSPASPQGCAHKPAGLGSALGTLSLPRSLLTATLPRARGPCLRSCCRSAGLSRALRRSGSGQGCSSAGEDRL